MNKIILLDRDGTINHKIKNPYISQIDDFKYIDDSIIALKELSYHGFKFIIITNQAGVGKGIMKKKELDKIHGKLLSDFKCFGIEILKK